MGIHQDFLDVGQSPDLTTFEERLASFAAARGFGLFGAIVITDCPTGRYDSVMVNNAPAAFKEAATNHQESQRDPVLRQLKSSNTPFTYDQELYVQAGAGDLWEEQAMYGYKTGINVALHLPGGKHFMLGFDREERLPASTSELTRLLADLQLLAVFAQDAAIRLITKPGVQPMEPPRLTKRELEILQWSYAGKTAGEMADILGISIPTVNFWMKSLFKKLDVRSRMQAIVKAQSYKIL